MKRFLSVLAALCVMAASGIILTACGSDAKNGSSASETTSATAAPTTAGKESGASAEKATSETKDAASKTEKSDNSKSKESKAEDSRSADSSDEDGDSDSGDTYAGMTKEDAKIMAILDVVTENCTVTSCEKGEDKDGADCWVVKMEDDEGTRYISYVSKDTVKTFPEN